MRNQAFGNGRNLGRRFTEAENHLREPLAQLAMRVEAREAEVLEWRRAHRGEDVGCRCGRIERPAPHTVEQVLQVGRGHGAVIVESGLKGPIWLNRQYNHGLCTPPRTLTFIPTHAPDD